MMTLLVEDQPLIALDTEQMLVEIGAASVASFPTTEQASGWLQSSLPAVALLDVNLGTTSSFDVADALAQRGIPFAFSTGYADTVMIPTRFAHVPVVQKPYTIETLGETLARCLAAGSKRA